MWTHATLRLPRGLAAAVAFAAVAVLAGGPRSLDAAQPADGDAMRWLVLIDDLHLDFRATGRLRAAVTAVVRPLVDAGVVVAMRTDGPSPIALSAAVTTSWPPVAASIKKLTGNALKPSDIVGMLGGPHRSRELVYRAREVEGAVTTLLRQVGEGPSALLLVSLGYRTDTPAVSAPVTQIAALAGQALVPVVPLDPRAFGLHAEPDPRASAIELEQHERATAESLRLLARDTGGTLWLEGDTAASVVARLRR
jgi:hypothetical protein